MKTIILTVMAAIAISGCALFKENKTPLSPHGQLNACLREIGRASCREGVLRLV